MAILVSSNYRTFYLRFSHLEQNRDRCFTSLGGTSNAINCGVLWFWFMDGLLPTATIADLSAVNGVKLRRTPVTWLTPSNIQLRKANFFGGLWYGCQFAFSEGKLIAS